MELKKIGGSLVKYAELTRIQHMTVQHDNAEQAITELRDQLGEFSTILKRLK